MPVICKSVSVIYVYWSITDTFTAISHVHVTLLCTQCFYMVLEVGYSCYYVLLVLVNMLIIVSHNNELSWLFTLAMKIITLKLLRLRVTIVLLWLLMKGW